MCLQIRFHKRMGADWTNRNSTTNHFSQLASKASQFVRVSATALVKAQWSVLLLPGALAPLQCHSPHLAEAACLLQAVVDWYLLYAKKLLEPWFSQAIPWMKGLDSQSPQTVRLVWQQVDPLPEATHLQLQGTAIPKSFLWMLALCPDILPWGGQE